MKRYLAICHLVAGLVLLMAWPSSNAQTLHVRLYPDNADYLEVVLDARDIASNEFIRNVEFDVELRTEQDQQIQEHYPFADKELPQGVYRNFISHGHTSIREAVGGEFVCKVGVGGGKAEDFTERTLHRSATTGTVQAAVIQTLAATPKKNQRKKSKVTIVGMGIAGSDDHVYVWFQDGTVSAGSTGDLDSYRKRYRYSLPPGKSPNDIVGMGIAGSDDHVYVWFKDGTVSSGSTGDLDSYRSPYVYLIPK